MKHRTIRALIAMTVAALSVAAPIATASAAPPTRPNVTRTTYTDCGQSGFLGARTCLDVTTAYGPVILVFSSATTLYASFAVCGSNYPSSFIATPLDWPAGGTITNTPGHPGTLTADSYIGGTGYGTAGYSVINTCNDVGAANLLAALANDPAQEFVVAN